MVIVGHIPILHYLVPIHLGLYLPSVILSTHVVMRLKFTPEKSSDFLPIHGQFDPTN